MGVRVRYDEYRKVYGLTATRQSLFTINPGNSIALICEKEWTFLVRRGPFERSALTYLRLESNNRSWLEIRSIDPR